VLLYLVRHGETDWNREHRIQGTTDVPLNDTGRAQAATAGDLLSRRHWDAVVASPLSRAFETASIIADRLGLPEPTTDAGLVERNYGEAEGLTYEDMQARFPGDTAVPGREEREDVAARALDALVRVALAHPEQSVVIVSHGGLIRAVLGAVDPAGTHGLITNGSIHSFEYIDGAFTLLAFDDPMQLESEHGEDLREQNPVEQREG
jgi:uncharacterized phosphatase